MSTRLHVRPHGVPWRASLKRALCGGRGQNAQGPPCQPQETQLREFNLPTPSERAAGSRAGLAQRPALGSRPSSGTRSETSGTAPKATTWRGPRAHRAADGESSLAAEREIAEGSWSGGPRRESAETAVAALPRQPLVPA
ncbi:unnamed protein product [Lampetra fluviatilis]